jgi:hypothetical protein
MFGVRSLGLIMLSVCGSQLFGADDPFVGTWTLNSEKSVFEGSSPLPMKVSLEITRGDSGALVINMTGFGNAQPLQLEVVAGYERCDGEEHIANLSRPPSNSWRETVTVPASVRAISCIRIDDHNRGLSTTVRQDGRLLASSWRTVSESGRVLTEITSSAMVSYVISPRPTPRAGLNLASSFASEEYNAYSLLQAWNEPEIARKRVHRHSTSAAASTLHAMSVWFLSRTP